MEAIISIAGSILGSLAGKAAEYTVDPIAQQLSYLFKHKSKFQKLRTKVDQLKDARVRVQQSVLDANRNGEEIFGDVYRWLNVVNRKISEQAGTQLQEDEEKAKKKCFVGLCPDFKSRYQLSKKAEKEANVIAELLNQKDGFGRLTYLPSLHLDVRPVKEYEAFESRSLALSGVVEALEDDNCNIIGVYGMGGVGKTTLVKAVAVQAKEKQLFDEVVFVAVTKTPNPENIQKEIAEKLGQKFVEASIDVRGDRPNDRIKKDKKVLIILDDIWVPLNLDALGIPSRDEHGGCKILMTSRNLYVLQSMESHKCFPVDIFQEDEAWNLFKNMAGDIVERSVLQSTAIEVSKKCAGLPIAIATVAKALKHKENLFEWKNALRELGRLSERNFTGIPANAYAAIELSYKFLEVEEHQLIFLLCSIMGHDAAIEDLLKYCTGLGLFGGLDTIEKVRTKVLTLVSDLKDSSLLLAGSTPERFDMHDVVCDVANSIASRDRHWLALLKEDVLVEWLDEETMRNFNLISLQYAKVSELPNELECPNLTFFSMSSEDSSLKIPNNFFRGMGRLEVLDFTKMHFSSLPLSMRFLKNIRTLCLSQCMLKDVVIIGELRNLEILNLRKSDIAMLPREIGQLTKLKLLDLSDCRDLEVIYPNVLSSLSRLEELYLYDSFDRWVIEGIDDPKSNASLVELQHLSHLTTLELHIPDEQAMPKGNLFSEKMERYKISIGMKWDFWRDRMETTRLLKLKINKSIHLYDEVKPLLRTTEYLHLNGGFQSEATLLFDKEVVFPVIKVVCLDSITVKKLWHDQLSKLSFGVQNLTSLEVQRCHNLKYVFTSSMVQSFVQLQILVVSDCNEIEEVIAFTEEKKISYKMVLPKLHYLKLNELPNFKRFCSGISIEFPFLKELEISECHVLSTFSCDSRSVEKSSRSILMDHNLCTDVPVPHFLFNEKVVFPALKKLKLHSISSIEKLWYDQLLEMSCVQNLTSLEVWQCHNLKYVFTSSMIKCFVQLRTLVVCNCDEIEEVIAVTEGILGEKERIVFPELHYMNLKNLPNLKRFFSGINPIEFPLLRELNIWECPVLSTFCCDCISVGKSSSSISMDHNLRTDVPIPHYLFNEKVALPMLQHLTITSIENLERLWPNQLDEDSFSELISFDLGCCNKLLNVFPLSMLTRLQKLDRLSIWECNLLEEIFESQQESSSARRSVSPKIFEFPKVTSLELRNLKSFYHKIHATNWPSLKEMKVIGCNKVEILFASQETGEKSQREIPIQKSLFWVKTVVPTIEELTLYSSSIERLWHDQLPVMSCGVKNLRSLEVRCCHNLKNLFTFSIVRSFVQLKRLVVEGCEEIEEIIAEERIRKMVFPKLDYLELKHLPNLKKFCSGNPIEFPFLRVLKIARCPVFTTFHCDSLSVGKNSSSISMKNTNVPKYLFNEKVALPMLKELYLSDMENLEGLWPNHHNVVFQDLRLTDCRKVKEIIEGGGDEDIEVKDEISFSQLNSSELLSYQS